MRNLILGTLMAASAVSQAQILGETNINTVDVALSNKGVVSAHDDVQLGQIEKIVLTEKDLHEAKVWGLTDEEEKRYLALKNNKSKYFYKGIRHTPIDILGLNSRNDAERKKYALKAARLEQVKVGRELAWNSVFVKAVEQVTRGVPVISDFDTKKYSPRNKKSVSLESNDHLVLFVKKGEPSLTLISALTDGIKDSKGTRLSIYITDATEREAQIWAARNGIPILMVSSRKIDLNIGRSQLENLNLSRKKTPLLILERNRKSKLVSLRSLAG